MAIEALNHLVVVDAERDHAVKAAVAAAAGGRGAVCLVGSPNGDSTTGTLVAIGDRLVLVRRSDGDTFASESVPLGTIFAGIDPAAPFIGWTGEHSDWATAMSDPGGVQGAEEGDDENLTRVATLLASSPSLLLALTRPGEPSCLVHLYASSPPYACLFDPDDNSIVTVVPLTQAMLDSIVLPMLSPESDSADRSHSAQDLPTSDDAISKLLGEWLLAALAEAPLRFDSPSTFDPTQPEVARISLHSTASDRNVAIVVSGSHCDCILGADAECREGVGLRDLIGFLRSTLRIDHLHPGDPLDVPAIEEPMELLSAEPKAIQHCVHDILTVTSWSRRRQTSSSMCWSHDGQQLWLWTETGGDVLRPTPANPGDILAKLVETISWPLFGD